MRLNLRQVVRPILVFACLLGSASAVPAAGPDWEGEYERLVQSHAAALSRMAAVCERLQLQREAELTRQWLPPRDPSYLLLFTPPSDPPAAAGGGNRSVRQWQAAFVNQRKKYAAALFDLAQRAAAAGESERAFAWAHETLREDPEHAGAARVVDLPRTTGPAFRRPTVPHPRLGWPARGYLRLETPNFEIVTTADRRVALELAETLEELHLVWRQMYPNFWTTPAALAARFADGYRGARRRTRFQVVLFADRQQYTAAMRRLEPRAAITSGMYLHQERTSYFFADSPRAQSTWRHEAAHQLFHETSRAGNDVGRGSCFWAVEGAAMYLESLRSRPGYAVLGGLGARRVQFARNWGLTGRFRIPLAKLAALGREEIQRSEEIRQIYSQAAGVAHFLIDRDRRSRAAFQQLLSAVYAGTATETTLFQLLGQGPETLDREYLHWLRLDDERLASLELDRELANLYLGYTDVSEEALLRLPSWEGLEWVDLTNLPATDQTVAWLAASRDSLRDLNLEGTRISDASAGQLAAFRQLEELDLSRTDIGDETVSRLRSLVNLRVLWLTKTRVSDASCGALGRLKRLEMLDISETAVTAAGWERLQRLLPKVQPPPTAPGR